MAAPALQMLAAHRQHVHHVDSVDAPPGALGENAFVSEDNAGAIVFAGHPPGHNTDNSRMPGLVKKDDSLVAEKARLDQALRVVGDLAFDILALAIEQIELP